jgi:predicted nucleic acid-binding protein
MIVLDSSFLVAYHHRRDVHHGAAVVVMVATFDRDFRQVEGLAVVPS